MAPAQDEPGMSSGRGGPDSICPLPYPGRARIPLEPPPVQGAHSIPKQQGSQVFPQCSACVPPSSSAASLHNCRLPPQCTKSKHVVLRWEEGLSAAWKWGQQEPGE